MTVWNERMESELRSLHEQTREARRLQEAAKTLPGQKQELQDALPHLEAAAKKARKKADRLSKGGLWAFPQCLTGKQAQAADKAEQTAREAYSAQESARQELADAERDLLHAQKWLAELEGCEAQFQALLEQKAALLRTMDGTAAKLEPLERQRDLAAHQDRVLQDALAGGKDAIPRLTRFAQQMDDLSHLDTANLISGLLADEKWGQIQESFKAIRAPFDAYCAPDFPSPVSEELKAACSRWYLRATAFLNRPCPSDLHLLKVTAEVRTIMTQAENLRGHIRDTFPALEGAVREARDARIRAMEQWEDFVCAASVPEAGG